MDLIVTSSKIQSVHHFYENFEGSVGGQIEAVGGQIEAVGSHKLLLGR